MNKISKFFDEVRHSYYDIFKVLCFVVAAAVIVIAMPRGSKFNYEFQKMRPWKHETLYAPFNFPIYKSSEQIFADRQEALKNVHPIFIFDVQSTENGRDLLMYMFDNQYTGEKRKKEFCKKTALRIYDSIQNRGIISMIGLDVTLNDDDIIDVVKNKIVSEEKFNDVFTMQTATATVKSMLSSVKDVSNQLFLEKLLLGSLRQNIIFAENLTKQAENQALSNVMYTSGMVQKDELIISEGEMVTEDKYLIITSLQEEYKNLYADSLLNYNNVLFGQIFLVTIVLFCLYMILRLFHKDVFCQLSNIVMILVVMLLAILPSFALAKYSQDLIYLIPVTLTVMLLFTFFDARITIMVQILTLILISFAMSNPFRYFFTQLIVSIIVIFSMSKRKTRSTYFRASLAVLLSYVVVYTVSALMFDDKFDAEYLVNIIFFATNAFMTLLALPLAFLFEKIFKIITEMTLLELSNTNSPLLRKLASEAPGTFQHVMQVADLCEEVIYNIGGNPMLVRAGAMYHDVGKMRNPSFFIENQNGKYNPHEDLSNEESAEIIINHVIDGVELCHEYRIPEVIIDFVRTHHGTRRTEYFYRQELRKNPDVDEKYYKYKGPIPFSKETAVLMMCDAVEAATRSLPDKTEISINAKVDDVIDGQIKAEQFGNTDITYRDINNIKKVLKKKLINVYHPRIEYPK